MASIPSHPGDKERDRGMGKDPARVSHKLAHHSRQLDWIVNGIW